MSWYVEQLLRDGAVQARLKLVEDTTVVRIGRALDNDVVLDDPHCAPYHANLELSADGHARLLDLNTQNGILNGRNKRSPVFEITDDQLYRFGQSSIRVRSDAWALAPERALSRRNIWPYALVLLLAVFAHGAWDLWLGDVRTQAPTYLNQLSGLALGLGLWSGMYALFGRLISGSERFFSHLTIACCGYLSGNLILYLLDILSFSSGWLWPMRITDQVIVIVAACTVRFHLKLADPRHWPTLRVVMILVASAVILIPLAQRVISHGRLTDVDTLHSVRHPALRLATPVPIATFSDRTAELKARIEKAAKADKDDDEYNQYEYD